MPDKHSSGTFRFVGRIIPVDGPDDPEKAVFIDIPSASLVTTSDYHEVTDGYLSHFYQSDYSVVMEIDQDPKTGVAYTLYQGAPPEGYFPPETPPAFDF